MLRWFHALLAKVLGRNLNSTPADVIIAQMNEPRALPLGRADFMEWSGRIIAGAVIPCMEESKEAFIDGQRFALADMILHLKPTEDHCPDAYFIHGLRKLAANQVAVALREEMRNAAKAKIIAREESEAAGKAAEAKQG